MTHTVNEQHPFRVASRTCQGPFLSIEFGEPGHVWTSFGRLERRAQIQKNLCFLFYFIELHVRNCELSECSLSIPVSAIIICIVSTFSESCLIMKKRTSTYFRGKNKYTITRVVPETETNCTISFPTCYLQNTHGTSVENGSRSWDISIIRAHFNLSRRLTSP